MPTPLSFPKPCTCCGTSHDAPAWSALPFVGVWHFDDEALELKNCHCGSTLAVELEESVQ